MLAFYRELGSTHSRGSRNRARKKASGLVLMLMLMLMRAPGRIVLHRLHTIVRSGFVTSLDTQR